ncbi:hypothetical protein LRS10_22860 [Phenylobacterium sp. J426]|uniref:hypothetical protein n=1 Tax=Phenylobacterium sp. J426 TaxID=2898439 RepID=UPI002150AE73|nr:hypothetical protein [Phenylobacterium sp. J426]MCR5876746.1 hypothetical protein [Phenylobacterium sp. J426]
MTVSDLIEQLLRFDPEHEVLMNVDRKLCAIAEAQLDWAGSVGGQLQLAGPGEPGQRVVRLSALRGT